MRRVWKRCLKPILYLMTVGLLFLTGCEGSETRDQVDTTVEELSGKKSLDRMDQMKKDIQNIQSQQTDHTKQLEGVDSN